MNRLRRALKSMWMAPALLALLFGALSFSSAGAIALGDAGDSVPQLLLPALFSGDGERTLAQAAYAPGQIAVGIRRDAVGAAALSDEIQASVIEPISMAGSSGPDDDGGVEGYLLRVPDGEEWKTIERLRVNPAIVFAQPNWIVRAAGVEDGDGATHEEAVAEVPFAVNDPLYANEQWYLQRILASRAWALSGRVEPAVSSMRPAGAFAEPAFTAALPIEVVVIDSGVDHTHADLAGNISPQGRNYIYPGQLPTDDCGHGTHVTGLIAANINNDLGIAGGAADVVVAPYKTLQWDPNAKQCTGFVSNVVTAIRDATNAGADIINLSLELDEQFDPLEAAVAYARSHGVLVIGAAGNCAISNYNCPVKYPARYGAVMAVAATDYFNQRAAYSPKGNEIDIAAPGGNLAHKIVSTWPESILSLCPYESRIIQGDGYCSDLGTSMASAVATGAAALIWSVRPDFSAEEVRDILEDTARPLPLGGDEVGDGLIDAQRGVRYALRSRLDVSPRYLDFALPVGTPSFETTLLMQNPSLEPVSWLITGTSSIKWLDPLEPISGVVRYGEPIRAPLVISATHLMTGTRQNTFSVEAQRRDGSRLVIPVTVGLELFARPSGFPIYLPSISAVGHIEPETPFVPYSWEEPDELGRIALPLLKDSNTGITLPVTIAVGSRVYTDARVYSDGYVLVPAIGTVNRSSNTCLPLTAVDGYSIFGWWGDLDPSRAGGRISVFRAGPDRAVIEFNNVYVAGGSGQERVSFQVVLQDDGSVGINYGSVPSATASTAGGPLPVTVGMQRQYGRLFNEVACVTDDIEVGTIPKPFQSLLFTEEDLF
ncbi:MAG: S8 family serine peptidase [Caldilineaceae bacterium]